MVVLALRNGGYRRAGITGNIQTKGTIMTNLEIRKLADANRALLAGTTEPMKLIIELIEQADVVFGAWPGPEAPEGVDTWLSKVVNNEALTIAGRPVRIRCSVIPCICLEEAIALQRTFGEPDHNDEAAPVGALATTNRRTEH
jgi:hypothetical protein